VHPATRHIPYRVQSRLKDIGYAKQVLGGLVLTDDGLQRIAIDRERDTMGCGRGSMSKPGLDHRHRNKDGEISGKHGNALVRTSVEGAEKWLS
jgi:hypothetical protein